MLQNKTSTKKTTAIYAFSGDPITFGHINIIKRASKIFDEVIVAIGVNPDKSYTFSLSEREDMAKRVLANFPRVKVTSFEGLLVDFAYEQKADVIVKGIRSTSDSQYESILNRMGESQKLGIETVVLFSEPDLAHVSSSAVKALQKEHGLIHDYVPLYVKQKLEETISDQFIIGITGEIGVGKSYVSQYLEKLGQDKGIEVHNIELDHLGHEILSQRQEPRYGEVREQIYKEFGSKVKTADGIVDRKILGEIVFDDLEKLEKLNKIMYQPMLVRLRRAFYGKKGIILINSALLVESGISYLCNNNVILVKADKNDQKSRLLDRDLTSEQIDRRLESQYDFFKKKKMLEKIIKSSDQGEIWEVDSSGAGGVDDAIFIKNIFGKLGK